MTAVPKHIEDSLSVLYSEFSPRQSHDEPAMAQVFQFRQTVQQGLDQFQQTYKAADSKTKKEIDEQLNQLFPPQMMKPVSPINPSELMATPMPSPAAMQAANVVIGQLPLIAGLPAGAAGAVLPASVSGALDGIGISFLNTYLLGGMIASLGLLIIWNAETPAAKSAGAATLAAGLGLMAGAALALPLSGTVVVAGAAAALAGALSWWWQ